MHIKKIEPSPGAAPSEAAAVRPSKGLASFAKNKAAAVPAPAAEGKPPKKGFSFFGGRKPEAAAPAPKGTGLFLQARDEAEGSASAAPAVDEAPAFATTTEPTGLLKRFGSARPRAAVEAEPAPTPDKAAPTSSLMGRFGRRSAAPAAPGEPVEKPAKPTKPVKPAKPAKPPKPAKAAAPKPGRKSGTVAVLVELEDGRQLAWDVSRDGLTPLDWTQSSNLLSFSPKDQRFSTDIPLSAKGAETLAIAEMGEDVRLVNASKSLKAVYATTTTRVNGFMGVSVGPGLHVLENLMPMSDTQGQERIGGLQLTDSDGSVGLVVLYHINAQGEIGAPQVTVNPGDLGFVLSQFVAARRLDQDSTQVVLVKNEDLVLAAEHFRAYPSQPTLLGMPLSTARTAMAVASFALAVGAAGYAGLGYVQLNSAKATLSNALSDKTRALAEADELLKNSLVSFAKTQALDASATVGTAQAVWVPGAKVSLEASLASAAHVVELPLTRTMSGGGLPSVLERVELDHVKNLIDQAAPEGCSKSVLNLTGGLNAAQISFECQNTVGGLLSYRLD